MESIVYDAKGKQFVRGENTRNRPERIVLTKMCNAHGLPPPLTTLPAGSIGEYFAHNDCYCFDVGKKHVAWIPGKFAMISDSVEALKGTHAS